MIFYKFLFKVLGGHTHVRLFSATNPKGTFGKNGDLSFRNEEWKDFCKLIWINDNFKQALIVPEEEDPTPQHAEGS